MMITTSLNPPMNKCVHLIFLTYYILKIKILFAMWSLETFS